MIGCYYFWLLTDQVKALSQVIGGGGVEMYIKHHSCSLRKLKAKKWTPTVSYEKCCILEDTRNRCCYPCSINEGPEDLRIT